MPGRILVLLDAVGTTIYPVPSPHQVYFETGRRHGSRLTLQTVEHRLRRLRSEIFGFPSQGLLTECQLAGIRCVTDDMVERRQWRRLVEHLFDDVDATGPLFEELWDHFGDPSHWQLYDDVPSTITALRRHDATIGIASNFDRRLLTICRGLPPLDSIAHVYPSSDVGFCKPDERFYRSIERDWPVPVVFAGDDPVHDWQAPERIGWTAFWLDRHDRPMVDPRLRSARIRTLNELVDRLGYVA